ncbi:MAG: extracellular solute-binding protein, partial [Kiritimatiellae bacterium]|nr:extracellular solute-binding protein [Kiritimatiellia bacterium]
RTLAVLLLIAVSRATAAPEPTAVTFLQGYDPDLPESPVTRQILALARAEPRLNPQKWGGLTLPGAGGRAPFMLSLAGGTAPDIYFCWFHIIRHDIEQGFCHPLNEWLGEDTDGDGQLSDAEARWPGWRQVPPLWRQVATRDGKVYGLPMAGIWYYGIVYRKDLVRQAGVDPEYIPATWDEFFRWCQRLTFPGKQVAGAKVQRGQRAFGLENRPWSWLPWMQAAGGSPIVSVRVSPTTGRSTRFAMEETRFLAPDTGEDLSEAEAVWQANFDSPEAIAAAAFTHRLAWAPWLRDPQSGEPVDLTPADLAAGRVTLASGREIAFAESDVIRGVARALPRLTQDLPQLFAQGEVVALFSGAELVEQLTRDLNLPPDMVGIMPFPAARPDLKPVFQAHKHFYSMTESVGRRPKAERDLVWRCIEQLASEAVNDETVKQKVLEGHARWCTPADLERLGFTEYLDEVPPGIRRNYERIAGGEILARTEPFAGFWQAVSDLIDRRLLGVLLADTGERFDYAAALRHINDDANRGLMFRAPEAVLARQRPLARVLFGIAAITAIVCCGLAFRRKLGAATATPPLHVQRLDERTLVPPPQKNHPVSASLRLRVSALKSLLLPPSSLLPSPSSLSPWLMLAPALLSIAVWSYYPLIRGAVMAFQEYRIVGETAWAGLDNFILVATDKGFWAAWARTFHYVGLTLLLGFLAPVLLALMLAEIPRGKIFFRTLYFLPHLTSALVIALLWKLMYDPTENGMLNQLLGFFGVARQTWLQDPSLAMLCCILPGVWAGAGMASLIYVAALQALPPDYYEAAAIDGAGILSRFRHITYPQLLPLMVINFVGAFIAAFQGMGSIFLLTFGGPGDATNVLSLAIWKEAYNNLRFSTATTMAWFLGVALIGFTYLQIRILRKVEFRRASTN